MPILKKLAELLAPRKFLVVLLISIAILGSLLGLDNKNTAPSDPKVVKSHSPANYQHGITPPISLGKLSDPVNSYINLHLSFYTPNLNGHQNIFQTAPGNEGLRLEISGSTAALVVADSQSTGGVKGLTISSDLNANQWYDLQIVARNGKSISASLNGKQVIDYKSAGLELKGSDVLIGEGYDKSRQFHGLIRNITLEERVYARNSITTKLSKLKLLWYLIGIFLFTYICYTSISKFTSNHLNKIDSNFIAIAFSVFTIIFYNIIFFDKYFPLTEGWFSTYSLIIQNGGVPYRDFYLFLTPLYPLQISLFQEIFGNNFYLLRILGLLISGITTLFLFLILRKFFKPLVACICTITAIIYYQSGVAFINYDFTQFLTLYCLCSGYFLVSIADNQFSKRININSFFAGFFASLAFLIKQSNGGIFLLFSTIAFLYLLFRNKNYALAYLFSLGISIPILTTAGYLYANSALPDFYHQVINGAIQSKGASLSDILFGWLKRLEFSNFLNALYGSKKITITSIALLLLNYLAFKFKTPSQISTKNYQNIFIVIFSYYVMGIIYISLIGGNLYEYLVSHKKIDGIIFYLQNIAFIGFIIATLIWILLSYVRKFPKLGTDFSLRLSTLLILSTGLILGNGTSAGISEISLFLPLALIVGAILSLPDPLALQRLFLSYICLIIIFNLADRKFKEPYAWWFISEPGIYQNSNDAGPNLLKGIKLSADSALTIGEISNAITSNSSPSDDVFFFPNIGGFYAITNRFPHSKSIITWFDFLPDKLASDEADRILKNPPKIIVNVLLPQDVWLAHETYFRGGKKMGQRDIQNAIEALTSKQYLQYSLIYTKQISPESKVEVWARN